MELTLGTDDVMLPISRKQFLCSGAALIATKLLAPKPADAAFILGKAGGGGGGGYVGPLDLTGSIAIVACGQRALSSAKLGSALYTIRRDSDDTEQSFSSDAVTGEVSVAAINAFLDGANGFGTSWANQSNANTLIQATTAYQPPWLFNVSNSKPGFSGSVDNDLVNFQTGNIVLPGGEMTVFAVVNLPDIGAAAAPSFFAFVQPDGEGAFPVSIECFTFYNQEGDIGVYNNLASPPLDDEWASALLTTNGTHLVKFSASAAGQFTVLVDGVDVGMTHQFGADVAIPAQTSLFQFPFGLGGAIGLEAIAFSATVSTEDSLAISQNMAAYYGITLP